jgi:hypothetical protein
MASVSESLAFKRFNPKVRVKKITKILILQLQKSKIKKTAKLNHPEPQEIVLKSLRNVSCLKTLSKH